MTRIAALLAFLIAGAAQAQPIPGTYNPVLPPGWSNPQSLSDWKAESLDIKGFILPTDPDATLGIGRAITQMVALGTAVELHFPCGTYTINGAISITTAANQGVRIMGDGSSCTFINQTADANGFTVSLTNYGNLFSTGAFAFTGITLTQNAASTTRTALSVSSTATSGTVGSPPVIDDVSFVSPSGTQLWGTGLNLTEIPNLAYISRVYSVYNAETTAGTHISINGNATSYSTSILMRDIFLVSGNKGLVLGNYLQGIHVNNLNTVNTLYSVYTAPTAQNQQEYQISNSYLDGKFFADGSGTASFNTLNISHTVFAGDQLLANDKHVTIKAISQTIFEGNSLAGQASGGVANLVGLYLTGTTFSNIFSGNMIQAYGNGGTGVQIDSGFNGALFNATQFQNNSTDVADSGTSNIFVSTNRSGVFYTWGTTNPVPPVAIQSMTGLYGASNY